MNTPRLIIHGEAWNILSDTFGAVAMDVEGNLARLPQPVVLPLKWPGELEILLFRVPVRNR